MSCFVPQWSIDQAQKLQKSCWHSIPIEAGCDGPSSCTEMFIVSIVLSVLCAVAAIVWFTHLKHFLRSKLKARPGTQDQSPS